MGTVLRRQRGTVKLTLNGRAPPPMRPMTQTSDSDTRRLPVVSENSADPFRDDRLSGYRSGPIRQVGESGTLQNAEQFRLPRGALRSIAYHPLLRVEPTSAETGQNCGHVQIWHFRRALRDGKR